MVDIFLIEEKIEEVMLLPIKPICQRKDMRKDGTSLIFIQYCCNSDNRTLLNTEIAIPSEYWDKKRLCIKAELPNKFGEVDSLNDDILRMTRIAQDVVKLANRGNIDDKCTFVKKLFKPDLDISLAEKEFDDKAKSLIQSVDKTINLDFFYQIDDYIQSKQRKVSEGMLKVYRLMKARIKAFEDFWQKPISFDLIDYNFYEALVQFLTYEYIHKRKKETVVGLKINTIGLTIKQFRIFINDRVRRKIIQPIDLTDFKIVDEEADAIYLSHDEIEMMYSVDLSDYPYLIEYRDLFVLACLTGLRFSDFSELRREDLRKGLLYKKQEKSEHWVVIPLRDEAKRLFLRQFSTNIPEVSNPEFNRHIKTVGEIAGINEIITFSHKKGNKTITEKKPKYEWITTHTGRRSFCTNEFLAGTPVKLIMKISGHKNEKDFYKYIRITPEEAAQKIKELWMDRNDMGAFTDKLKKIAT